MTTSTSISWTDATWNPIRGCSRVSEGCRHCYAEQQAGRIVRMGNGKPTKYDGLVKLVMRTANADERDEGNRLESRWTGEVSLDPETLMQPLRWRKPRRIFVNSMSDLFHEKLTNEQIAAVFGVMAACQHTFQVLTKRAKRMREWFKWVADQGEELRSQVGEDPGSAGPSSSVCTLMASRALGLAMTRDHERHGLHAAWPLPNVWIGVSVENQAVADERIPDLLATPAAVRFLSCEPLIAAVDLEHVRHQLGTSSFEIGSVLEGNDGFGLSAARNAIDWVIAGCESGPGARPCAVEWLRALRDQCSAAGTPFFLKQAQRQNLDRIVPDGLGDYIDPIACGAGSHEKARGVIELPYLDGVQHMAFPEVS